MEKNVQLKYRLFRWRNGIFYWQDNSSRKQGTLRTGDRREAERLLNAMNESHREPTLNLTLARAYLAAHDPRMAKRTWQAVMDEMATHGIPSIQARCARGFRSKAYDPIRNKSKRASKRNSGKIYLDTASPISLKSFPDYVIRHFNASSAELTSPRALNLRWNCRLTRSPDPTGTPSQSSESSLEEFSQQ